MIKKGCKNLILVLTVILSAQCKKDQSQSEFKQDSDFIVYELNDEISSLLNKEYGRLKKTSEEYEVEFSPYVVLDDFSPNTQRQIIFSNCNECKISEVLKNTKRFLRINDHLLVPVVFDIDFSYEVKTKYSLRSQLGGEITIIIDGNDKVSSFHHGM